MGHKRGSGNKRKLVIDQSPCPYIELYCSNRYIDLKDEDYARVKEAIRSIRMHEEELREMRQDLSTMFLQRYYGKIF
jgi:hypothetical protein